MNVEEKLFVHITFVGKVNVPDAPAALIFALPSCQLLSFADFCC